MRIAVISTQNRLLSGAIIKYMQERSELRPVRILEDNDEEPDGSDSENEGENLDPDAGKSEQQVIDELTGQTNLFSEKDFEEDQKDKDWLSKQ